jgi:GTPase SAR1 family protein
MRIILEGLDRTGKTSIISDLKREERFRDYPVRHDSGPAEHFDITAVTPEVHAMHYIWDEAQLMKDTPNGIWDRSYFSECVWGALYRGYDTFNKIFFGEDNDLLDTIMFILIDEPATLIYRDDGHSLPQNMDDWHALKIEFEQLATAMLKHTAIPTYVIHIGDQTQEEVYAIVSKWCNRL